MVASVQSSGPALIVGSGRVLVSEWPGVTDLRVQTCDVSTDGRSLTAVLVQPPQPVSQLTIALNWTQELTRPGTTEVRMAHPFPTTGPSAQSWA